MEFELDGTAVGGDSRQPYLERFIHGAVYEARPEVLAVVHAHAEDVLPFGITATPLRPVIQSGSFMGTEVPVWDIRDRFGDTNLLVTNMPQGRDLAARLAGNNVALMRGHGFVAAARSLIEVVRMSVYVPRNARVQMAGMQLGAVKPLSRGEIEARNAGYKPHSPETWRAWEYWASRAGCGELLEKK
jgi:HCOMODA/2-hydroxy-3-carboxy-muconic semialdehyde decarboxylase